MILSALIIGLILIGCSKSDTNSDKSEESLTVTSTSSNIIDGDDVETIDPNDVYIAEYKSVARELYADYKNDEDTLAGFVFLDLDFDGIPELIVTRVVIWQNDNGNDKSNNITSHISRIYKYNSGHFSLIDNLYCPESIGKYPGLILGLNANTHEWLYPSYTDKANGKVAGFKTDYVDYYFTFDSKNDEINYTEIFRHDEVDKKIDEIKNIEPEPYKLFSDWLVKGDELGDSDYAYRTEIREYLDISADEAGAIIDTKIEEAFAGKFDTLANYQWFDTGTGE